MKIRTQNLILIVGVIFLPLTSIVCILSYLEQRAEIEWGIREEIKALVTTTAAFIDGDACQQLGKEGGPKDLANSLLPKRILKMEAKKTIINQKEEKKNRIWISIWEYLEGVFEPQRQLHQDLKVTFIETIFIFQFRNRHYVAQVVSVTR